jgi:hypothetical protein
MSDEKSIEPSCSELDDFNKKNSIDGAALENQRLQASRDRWKRVADLFGKAYTTDESGKFAISNGSDLFRAVMAYERALRDERNEFPGETSGNLAPPR